MVQQQLMLEVAKDEGVLPTPDDVTKELDRRKRQNADYITTLEHQGLSLDEIKQDVLLSLASERIQTKGVTVSVAEAKKYISDNKQAFTNPPQAKLLLVVVKSSDKAKVDADLKSGQSFPAVAMKYSTVPNARQNGGAFPVTNVSQMPPVLQKLINSTPVDKTTPWQKDGENWVKFDIQSKTPAKPMPITDDVVDAVQRELAKKKSTNGPDFQKRMIEKINSAKVDLSVPAYQDGWAAFVQSNQAHPGQAAPRTAAPGAPIPQKK
jgi:parvulin-like peptidyl-prolyl isomerase